jgi:hypothetical protein
MSGKMTSRQIPVSVNELRWYYESNASSLGVQSGIV